ncbi:MAG: type IV toxin-antitoxin system AbiEi family antitoxin [Chitinispirillaceae bacterium]|nr:type IV toxin-antitoxin system AbiEi family antitoxin [Chitinispirillaceae bacterium]
MTIKLSGVFKSWPHGTVAGTRWFEHQGIQRNLLTSYKRSGWINSVGQGAYTRSDDTELDWTGAVYALQRHYEYDVHPGSRTTFELRGMAHYVRMGTNTVFLLSPDKRKNFLPAWFHSFENKSVRFRFIQERIFEEGFTDLEDYRPPHCPFTIRISSVEQALLEMLSLVNRHMDLDEAFKIFENVRTVDTVRMSSLLRQCTSVKTKRLFMVMATRHQMPWLKALDLQGVDFGSGSRTLVPGGHFDRSYSITVPEGWYENVSPEV